MRYLVVLLMVSGCAYNVALHPRGGDEVAKGSLNHPAGNMTVTVRGATYTGRYYRGTGVGVGLAGARPAIGVGLTNQFAGVLKSEGGLLRCEFVMRATDGDGVCADSQNVTYDMLIGQ